MHPNTRNATSLSLVYFILRLSPPEHRRCAPAVCAEEFSQIQFHRTLVIRIYGNIYRLDWLCEFPIGCANRDGLPLWVPASSWSESVSVSYVYH